MKNIILILKKFLCDLWQIFETQSGLLFKILAAFLFPIQPLILLVILMILVDTVTGIWKAKKTGEIISSRKLSNVLGKLLLYESGLILFFVLEKYMLGDFVHLFIDMPFFLTKIIAIFFCSIEVVSINENINVIYKINLLDLFRKFVTRIKTTKEEMDVIAKK